MAAAGVQDGAGWQVQVHAGPHRRRGAAVRVQVPEEIPEGPCWLEGPGGPEPAQVIDGCLWVVLGALEPGETRSYALRRDQPPAARCSATLREDRVVVVVAGTPAGELLLRAASKPFLYPLRLPDGRSVVRRWPPDAAAGDATDHPHHRGVWVGHGDVNGVDFWGDDPRRLGRQLVRGVQVWSGPVAAGVHLALDWVDATETVQLQEERTYVFWDLGPAGRLVDILSVYRAPALRAVRFGDTKEGALCCLRLASGLEGRRGGLITTSEGARTEAEAWGSAAGWCDCSGRTLEADGQTLGPEAGVAVLDHPDNPLAPMRWHVRDYGLLSANPFALGDYRPRAGRTGEFELPAGAAVTFRFRIYAHAGDAAAADVSGRYADWVWPPRLTLRPR